MWVPQAAARLWQARMANKAMVRQSCRSRSEVFESLDPRAPLAVNAAVDMPMALVPSLPLVRFHPFATPCQAAKPLHFHQDT
jgi:hypothetical protein